MFSLQFVSMTIVIQMKSMKVICNSQNMMIQEFQHDMESQLIQLSMMKMQMIQFLPMMMAIQMKSMKMMSNLENMMIQESQHDME
jgi:hypothetical protein